MVFFALLLLFFANNQSPSVLFDTSYTAGLADGNYFPVFLIGMFMALFVVYGFDTAGTFGEETVDAGRQAPRGVLAVDLAVRASSVPSSCSRSRCRSRTSPRRSRRARRSASRSRRRSRRISRSPSAASRSVELYLVVILIAVYVCTLAIQGATVRLMFSMGRDRRLPLGGTWGHVSSSFRTPANAALAVGVLAAIPFFITGRREHGLHRDRGDRHDLHQLLPVQPRRAHRPDARLAAPGSLVQASGAGARSSTSWPSCGAGS